MCLKLLHRGYQPEGKILQASDYDVSLLRPRFVLVALAPKDKPIHEVRLGSIKNAVWKNHTQSGVRFNVTFSRLYKDGDKWKSTDSFGRDDLLVVAKVADKAHSWIFEHGQEEGQGKRSGTK